MPDILKDKMGVGAVLYSVVLAYNTETYGDGKPAPRTWADYFDTAKFPGPRGMARCEKIIDGGVLETALLGDGVPADRLYPLDVERAFKKLEAFKGQVGKWWQAGAEAPQALVDGEVAISSAYNGRVYAARKDGAPLGLSWDGSLIQYDYWIVMKSTKNFDNAMKFLAFFAKAEQQASFAKEIAYGPVNNDAYAMIDAELAKWLPGAPDKVKQQVYQDYGWWNQLSDGKSNWDRAIERCSRMLAQ
jgi:putative spermidine/putrescine transport system substrate-binding protein